MVLGLTLVAIAIALRFISTNRHVRGRLIGSAFVFTIYTAIAAVRRYGTLTAELDSQLTLALPLLLTFGVINGMVALVINPWRVDRLPDRFPTIVQDAIGIALFALVATLVLQDRIFATTAVGAVVIGLALQDTLGNLFAGLAVQIEKPFRVGQWVRIAEVDGLVREVTWRATKIRTKSGTMVIVPNSVLARDTITNYSEPTDEVRLEFDVGASYSTPPNEVKAAIMWAITGEPRVLASPPPEILLHDFGASGIVYRVRVWTRDFANDDPLRDRLRSNVYYAFRRADIVMPWPIQVNMFKEDMAAAPPDPAAAERAMRAVPIFATLSEEQWHALSATARQRLYGAGEVIVREGESGSSMFVVASGAVAVIVGPGQTEVTRLGPGDFFGEMSLLTGAPRTATVTAAQDSQLLEMTAEAFRRFILENPAVVDQIGMAVAARAQELDQHRAAESAAAPSDPTNRFMARVRRFLHLAPS
jgi:small-conductance mechanosensitive channel/CRP-like cAMP-binding protein